MRVRARWKPVCSMLHVGARDGDDESDGELPRLVLVVDAVARDHLPVGARWPRSQHDLGHRGL